MPLLDTLLFLLGALAILHFAVLPFLDRKYQDTTVNKKILLAGLIGATQALKKVTLVGLITLFCFSVILSVLSLNTHTVAKLVQLSQWAHKELGSLKEVLNYFFAFLVIVFYVFFAYLNAQKYDRCDKALADLDQQAANIHVKITNTEQVAVRLDLYRQLSDLSVKRTKLEERRAAFLHGSSWFSKIFPGVKSGFQVISTASLSFLALSLIVIECTSDNSAMAAAITKIQISSQLKQIDRAYEAKLKELENVEVSRENEIKANFLAQRFTVALMKDPVWGLQVSSSEQLLPKHEHAPAPSASVDDVPTVTEEWVLAEKKPEKFAHYVNVSDISTAGTIEKNTLSLQEEILANLNGFIVSNMSESFFPAKLPHGVSEEVFRSVANRMAENGFGKVIKDLYNLKIKVFFLSLSKGHTLAQAEKEMTTFKHYIPEEELLLVQSEIKKVLVEDLVPPPSPEPIGELKPVEPKPTSEPREPLHPVDHPPPGEPVHVPPEAPHVPHVPPEPPHFPHPPKFPFRRFFP